VHFRDGIEVPRRLIGVLNDGKSAALCVRRSVSMSVAVSTNLADAVILGVDSAISLPGPPPIPGQVLPPNVMHGGVLKVYEDAEKLFPLGNRNIAIATFGTAMIGNRTLGSQVRNFVEQLGDGPDKIEDVVEEFRKFFMNLYGTVTVPTIEKLHGKKFSDIPEAQRPGFGFVIAGFSRNAGLAQVWAVFIPGHAQPGTAQRMRAEGDFNINWYALFEPINRYMLGYSTAMIQELQDYVAKLRGSPFSDAENAAMKTIIDKHQFLVPVAAMPIPVGVAFTRFLVELVINHHRFAIGAPVVGGRSRIAVVSYKGCEIVD